MTERGGERPHTPPPFPLPRPPSQVISALERGRIQVENKDRHADDIRKDVELAGIEADKVLSDQVDLDMRIKVSKGGKERGARPL